MVFKAAIIGCGNIAGGYDKKVPDSWSFTHAGAYHLCPDTALIAVADTSPEALKIFSDKWKVNKLYEDYREMLGTEEINIVSLCLPTEKHFEAFKYACEKDIPAIFCEKPLSYDLKEAKEMVKLSNKRVVSVNYFRRWNPSLDQLRKEIINGVYGNIVNITVRYTKGIYVNSSHLLDLIRWFLGEPEKIQLIKIYDNNKDDPGVDYVVTFKNRITSYFLHVPDVEYVFIDIDILTSKGRIVIGQRGQKIEKYNRILEPYYTKFDIIKRIEDFETQWRDCFTFTVKEIVECLKKGGQTSCTPEDGLRTLELCNEIISQIK